MMSTRLLPARRRSRRPASLVVAVHAAVLVTAVARAQAPAPTPAAPALGAEGVAAVLNRIPPRLSLVDLATLTRTRVLPTHRDDLAGALNVELSPDGRAAYVMHADNSVTRLDLTLAAPVPEVLSQPPTAVAPGYPITMRDLERSADGRYLVATAFDVGAWYYSVPTPRCRVSIYDLATGGATHTYVDTTPNDLAPAELDVVIDAANRAWITDGDQHLVVVFDLATATVVGAVPAAQNAIAGVPGGGVGGPPPPLVTIAPMAGSVGWFHASYPGTKPYLRVAAGAAAGFVDFPYAAALMFELESDASSPLVAITRPKSTLATPPNPAPDQILLLDVTTGLYGATAKLPGEHRFLEIEFAGPPGLGRVVGLDFAADAVLFADFSAWIQNPSTGVPTLTLHDLPTSAIAVTNASDGVVAGRRYVFHDGLGRLGSWSLNRLALEGAVALVPGEPGQSVDLEVVGDGRCHED